MASFLRYLYIILQHKGNFPKKVRLYRYYRIIPSQNLIDGLDSE